MNMKKSILAAFLLALTPASWTAEPALTLKGAFKDFFPIGSAVNRSMVTGGAGFRRSAEQNAKDTELLKEQFNQISPENDLKWQLIHPREGTNGFDFSGPDAF